MSWLEQVQVDFPELEFRPGRRFAWSPKIKAVIYDGQQLSTTTGRITLLHEVAHGMLKHRQFTSDLELLKMEVEAWRQAKPLAEKYQVKIDTDYIDDCLESYRDWLYQRSTCVTCGSNSFQNASSQYQCHICGSRWTVPNSQLCRIQRRQVKTSPV